MTALSLIVDPTLDADGLMLEGIDTTSGPLFSVSETAKFFFDRSSHWIRWLESCNYPVKDTEKTAAARKKAREKAKAKGRPVKKVDPYYKACGMNPAQHSTGLARKHKGHWRMMLDGELLTPIRTGSNARKYDLSVIEKIAHALASHNVIDGNQLRQALTIVRAQAEMHGYLQSPLDFQSIEVECEDCVGTGLVTCEHCLGNGTVEAEGEEVDCSQCTGRGEDECQRCDGTGAVDPNLPSLLLAEGADPEPDTEIDITEYTEEPVSVPADA